MRFAVLADQQARERILFGFDTVRHAHQDGAAFVRRNRSHAPLAGLSGCDRPLHVGSACARHSIDQGAGRRISDFVDRPIGSSRPRAIDQHLHGDILPWSVWRFSFLISAPLASVERIVHSVNE